VLPILHERARPARQQSIQKKLLQLIDQGIDLSPFMLWVGALLDARVELVVIDETAIALGAHAAMALTTDELPRIAWMHVFVSTR
jgi:hypothetical protein